MEEENRRALPKRTGYPRRRAATACSTCRERKKKCDNARPTCAFCQRIGAQCRYDAVDASSFDLASLQILDRLSTMEVLMREMQRTFKASISAPRVQQQNHLGISPLSAEAESQSCYPPSSPRLDVWEPNLNVEYGVGTDMILQWPFFKENLYFLSQKTLLDFRGTKLHTYLDDAFTRTESSSNGILTKEFGLFHISTEQADIQLLVEKFLSRVHIKNPILTPQELKNYCLRYYEHGALFDLETCLVLLVCALGAVATDFAPDEPSTATSPDDFTRHESLKLGNCYFSAAEKRLGAAMRCYNTLAVQCLCLAGIYHMYILEPVNALRMFHVAGSSLQVLLCIRMDSTEGISQLNSSLVWICFKSEREILAELPILRPSLREPGTSQGYPLPFQGELEASGMKHFTDEVSWYFFLSEIALRRISDEVADVVFNYIKSPSEAALEELIPIASEFERQVQTWREHLPANIKFPDVPHATSSEGQHYSRGRYYRVLELVYRPFVFTAIHNPDCSAITLELASKGLTNASNYLQHCHLTHRHHGLWLQLRNELKESCFLLAAARSQLSLPFGWYSGVQKTLQSFEHWRAEFPACQSYVQVVLALDHSSPGQEMIT